MAYKDFEYRTNARNHVHAYLLRPLLKILGKRNDRVILDVGCGNGWLCNHLIELGYNAYGTDASTSGIAIAKKTNSNRFFLQDITKDVLPEELTSMTFNTIISTEVIEHLYDPRAYFKFCKTVLLKAGGGELILSTPYHGYLKNIVLSVTGNMEKHFTVLWDGGHIKFWSKETLYKVLKESGYSDMQFIGCGRVAYLWKSMIVVSKLL